MNRLRKTGITALLLVDLHSTALMQKFLQMQNADALEISVNFSGDEQRKISELKSRLLKENLSYETIDSILENENLELHRGIVKSFGKNPEKDFSVGKINYAEYRKKIGLDAKIRDAPAFSNRYKNELDDAERIYGIDQKYIIAILGIESSFGESKTISAYKAINSLVTQYILTKRQDFAYEQIKELIIYSQRTGIPIFAFDSSYAGAIGIAQFIPSSLNRAFVGKNGNVNKANPMDMVDCIYSVANYLRMAGWDTAENGKTPVKGSKNWQAIYKYNNSEAYVQAVIELANSLNQR